MPEIVLTTLNAKYIHAAFGLRYLLANLGPLRSSTSMVEFDINQTIDSGLFMSRPREVARLLASFASPPSTFLCDRCHYPSFWTRCRACSNEA
jgi:hypothetical protein